MITYLDIACIDLHQNGPVGEGSDHLQLIKFWPSCPPPERGSAAGGIFFGSLQPACSVCVSLEHFFHFICKCGNN